MDSAAPLPFRAKLPGKESISFTEIRDVSARVEGLLHFDGTELVLEWEEVEEIDEVSLMNVSEETVRYEAETLVVPLRWLAGAELVGGILRPRLRLLATGLGAFDGMPAAKGRTLDLPYTRADRLVAVAMRNAIEAARQELAFPTDSTEVPLLSDTETPLPR